MKKIILIGIGGFIGAICRYGIRALQIPGTFPITTLCINTLGCFVIAFVLTLTVINKFESLKLGLTTGFCGAFTTFSTLCKESVELLKNGVYGEAIIYILLMIVLGLIAVYLGAILADILNHQRNSVLKALKHTEEERDEVKQ